jgi:hypothetical protein
MQSGKTSELDNEPMNNISAKSFQADIKLLDEFQVLLRDKMDMRSCCYFVRNLLRYLCHHDGLVTHHNAPLVFRLFLMRLDQTSLEITAPNVLLMMYELTLFN